MTKHPLLKEVSAEKRFFLPDGTSIASLKELSSKIDNIPSSQFSHHVNHEKNDFHAWVTHVVKDDHLSKSIEGVKDQKKMSALISRRVRELEGRDSRREIASAIAAAAIVPPKNAKQSSTSQGVSMTSSSGESKSSTSKSITAASLESMIAPPRPIEKKAASSTKVEAAASSVKGGEYSAAKITKPQIASSQISGQASPIDAAGKQGMKPLMKPLVGAPKRARPMIEAIRVEKTPIVNKSEDLIKHDHKDTKAKSEDAKKKKKVVVIKGSLNSLKDSLKASSKDSVNDPVNDSVKDSSNDKNHSEGHKKLHSSPIRPFRPIRPLPPKLKVIAEIENEKNSGEEKELSAPKPYYHSHKGDHRSSHGTTWQSYKTCDHSDHFKCLRCGMMEFGIGLAVGVLSMLMFAKAFF